MVQNRQQTHDRTLIGSGANGLGIQECRLAEALYKLIQPLAVDIIKCTRFWKPNFAWKQNFIIRYICDLQAVGHSKRIPMQLGLSEPGIIVLSYSCSKYQQFSALKKPRAAVVHLNFRAGSTLPFPVCTVPRSTVRTSWCNKVDAVRLYASYRLNLLLLKRQRCVKGGPHR